jgi:hypothetical protein
MVALPLPKPYKRLGNFPMDEDSVFLTQESMEAYIAGGSSYPGHIVSLVSIVQNKVDTFKILPDKTYVATGGSDEKNKGWKATEAQLKKDLPVGKNGWFALIGETDTFWTWDADTNAWVNTNSSQAPLSVDANPIEGSINPVSSGGAYAALLNKADKNHTHEVDAVPTQDSTNPVSSGGAHTALGNKADKATGGTEGNLTKLDANGNPIDSNIKADTVLQTGNIDLSDIEVGEKKIVTVKKLADGSAVVGEAISQLDKLGAPSLSDLLDETNPLWDGDEIVITGDNLTGALGENSQEYRIGSDFFLCVSHNTGTDITNGSATWVRNRGQDSLTVGVAHDDNIIGELETESGWSVANFKQIANKSKKGTWFRAITGGYLYMCIDKTNGWTRVGFPTASDLEITSISHPALTTNLNVHDFATNGMYDESADVANESAEQGQEFWDTANNAWYKRNMNGYWAKMN